ncbi:hypothetical protein SESBI_50402 [Sesbania bispinosa]|nr:hypothetical protein SESBI_50402 [Sesbania bispinosa]
MDTWSHFEALGLAKDLGYVDKINMWWKEKGATFKRGLKQLCNDEDALELASVAVEKNCEMEIYLEHVNEVENDVNQTVVEENVTHTEVEVEVNETDVNMNQIEVPGSVPNSEMGNEGMNDNEAGIHENCENEAEVDRDSSDDSMRDVHFEDDEEERAIGADDGFTMGGMDHNEPEVENDDRAEDNAGDASGVADRAGDNTQRTFVPPEVADMHNIDEEYESEELESDVESIDGDVETITKY